MTATLPSHFPVIQHNIAKVYLRDVQTRPDQDSDDNTSTGFC